VLFDLDADGNFDDATLSDERFAADDSTAYVSIGHGHWSFEVAPDGASLVLRRRDDVDAPRPSVSPGASAPDFTYVGDGDERTLKSLRGSPVVLEFFAAGCGFSHEAGSQIADAAGALRGAGTRLISVSTDGDASEARSFADEYHKDWPVLVGAEAERVSRLYRVTSTPTLILIDEQGTIETRGNWRDLRTRIESGL
jgi:peroxiredoxin